MSLTFVSNDCDMIISDRQDPPKASGAEVVFRGLVRGINHEKQVAYLDYEAHEKLASSMFLALIDEVSTRCVVHEVLARHRLGRVYPGQTAVIIRVRAAHRHEAFLACQYVMNELKKMLPIWRKEVYSDESFSFAQGGCEHHQHHGERILKPTHKALKAREIIPGGLKEKRLLLVGAGGLGCPLAINLAALGFGHLSVYDGDRVELSNLARQFMYTITDVGQGKAMLLKRFIEERNPAMIIDAHPEFIDEAKALRAAANHDIIIDATDCPYSKNMLKHVAYRSKTPLVQGSVYQTEGEVLCYTPSNKGACLSCYDRHKTFGGSVACSDTGVLTHACSFIAALMAEAVLAVASGVLSDACSINLADVSSMRVKKLVINKDEHCVICGIGHEKKLSKLVRLHR